MATMGRPRAEFVMVVVNVSAGRMAS